MNPANVPQERASQSSWTLRIYEPGPTAVVPIDAAAELLGLSRHMIAVCCKHGIVSSIGDPLTDGWRFNHEALRMLRRIEGIHALCGGNVSLIRKLLELQSEVKRLEAELRHARAKR